MSPHLRTATEQEKRSRDAVCYEAWGPPLSCADWFAREARLREHRWAREAMTTWLWCAGDVVLSSCETFRMDSRWRGAPGHTFGVASVFTEAPLRGRGHAGAMLRALNAQLRAEPSAQATILFSDVGAPIYERAGFSACPAFDRVLEPRAADGRSVEWVHETQLADALASLSPPEDRFAVRPSAAQLDWHLERERIYAGALGRARPPFHGARAGSACALWAGSLRSNELVVLWMQPGDPAESEAVLRGAAHAAQSAALDRVVLWETPEVATLPLGRRVAREGSLPMLAPLTDGLAAEDWRSIPRALWI